MTNNYVFAIENWGIGKDVRFRLAVKKKRFFGLLDSKAWFWVRYKGTKEIVEFNNRGRVLDVAKKIEHLGWGEVEYEVGPKV